MTPLRRFTLSTRPVLLAVALALPLPLSLTVAGTAAAQSQQQQGAPNAATIQWAQQILDEAGFYNGRAHGRMDAATATAISNYQRSVGLRATGRLDQSTIDRMLADRESAEKPTMGNLADPTARARSSTPQVREQDVIPRAAPSAPSVQADPAAGGGDDGSTILGGAGPTGAATAGSGAGPTSGGTVEQPRASARAGVETEGGADPYGTRPVDLQSMLGTDLVRYGVLGLIAVILVFLAGAWGFSGRRKVKPGKLPPHSTGPGPGPTRGGGMPRGDGPLRQAPTLGPAPSFGPARREPVLTAAPPAPGTRGGPGPSLGPTTGPRPDRRR
ncbi:MAG: localization factor PodJL [Pseudomonadota bacterium]|jgi:peptidoglycan hydrolase-like protein with peptidoglycan-binding domain